MMRIQTLFVFILLNISQAMANLSLQIQPPPAIADLSSEPMSWPELQIVYERLRFDFSSQGNNKALAYYVIFNDSASPITTDLYFITPFFREVKIVVNNNTATVSYETIDIEDIEWASARLSWMELKELAVARFNTNFLPQQQTIIEIEFVLPPGYDNTKRKEIVKSAPLAHILNWNKKLPHQNWYLYYLAATNTFRGGIKQLEVEVIVDEKAYLITNLKLEKKDLQNGLVYFGKTFHGLPASYFEANVLIAEDYNFLGGSFALGLTSDFSSYTKFVLQSSLDIFFSLHQFSLGIEGNPFDQLLNFILNYSLILGFDPYYILGDIRTGIGLVFAKLPEEQLGLRLTVGLRITAIIFETNYNVYPLSHDLRTSWTFLLKVSI